jgi:hypothetical protein
LRQATSLFSLSISFSTVVTIPLFSKFFANKLIAKLSFFSSVKVLSISTNFSGLSFFSINISSFFVSPVGVIFSIVSFVCFSIFEDVDKYELNSEVTFFAIFLISDFLFS